MSEGGYKNNNFISPAPDLSQSNFAKLNTLLDKTMAYSAFIRGNLPESEQGDDSPTEEGNEDEKVGEKRKREEAAAKQQQEEQQREQQRQAAMAERKPDMVVPSLLQGTLRDYQIVGVNWLISLYKNGVNGILADEMGLGKTIITIGFIAHLWEKKITGPYAVVAPLSTLANWEKEAKKWLPSMPSLLYHGTKEDREAMRSKFDKQMPAGGKKSRCGGLLITSYDIAMNDIKFFMSKKWKYLVVDEAHRLKNFDCKLIKDLKKLDATNRLLLTGTPLQNNLAELWSLLNFILPDIFDDLDSFRNWFNFDSVAEDDGEAKQHILHSEQQNQVISKLHDIMRPFMLRRLKADIGLDLPKKKEVVLYCSLTHKQAERYKAIKDKTLDAYLQSEQAKGVVGGFKPARVLNIIMQLRKVCNHPFLFEQFDPFLPETLTTTRTREVIDEYDLGDRKPYLQKRKIVEKVTEEITKYDHSNATHRREYHDALVNECGKFGLLDRMLPILKKHGHKVLLFSQMTSLLDLLEDYLDMTDYQWCRIDGTLPQKERQARIDAYNEDEKIFLFLLSTRAGGLGINLTSADTVIIYDSDWNPQADLQAQDRCHRIGQTKPVAVYRLITMNTVEAYLLKRATAKLKLEHLVIEKGKFHSRDRNSKRFDASELEEVLNMSAGDAQFGTSHNLNDELLGKLLNRDYVMGLLEKKKANTTTTTATTTTTTTTTNEKDVRSATPDKSAKKQKKRTSTHERNAPARSGDDDNVEEEDDGFEVIEELPTLF